MNAQATLTEFYFFIVVSICGERDFKSILCFMGVDKYMNTAYNSIIKARGIYR